MTPKKRKYAEARMAGNSGAASAVMAGYAETGAKQQAYKLDKDPDVLRIWEKAGWSKGAAPIQPKPVEVKEVDPLPTIPDPETGKEYSDPLSYFERVMNSLEEETKVRLDAAKALATYTRAKAGEVGKKEQKNEAASKVAGGRFSPAKPPLSVVSRA